MAPITLQSQRNRHGPMMCTSLDPACPLSRPGRA